MSQKDSKIARVKKFAFEYPSELATILLAVIGTVSLILEKKSVGIEALILSVLALMAFSQIVNSRRMTETVEASATRYLTADRYLLKSLTDENLKLMRSAETIDMIGVNLKDSFEHWYTMLSDRLKAGAKIRVILMNPECAGMHAAVMRSNGEDENILRANYEYTIRKIEALSPVSPTKTGITVKLIDYPPSFAMVILRNSKQQAVCLIKMYGHDGVLDGIHPYFEIQPWRENWWFDYFNHQFQVQWDGKLVTPLRIR